MDDKQRFATYKCCVVIPTYNNEKTLAQVIRDVLQYTENVIVVNDGATDSTPQILASFGNSIRVITHSQNQGKGKALRNAFQYARKQGYDYVITIDSDGQHFASDLPLFLQEIENNPNTLVIGARNMAQENVPGKSSFGNRFSNFWFWVETGIQLTDTQSGYRLYPVFLMEKIRYLTHRFEFEVEVIVKAVWQGIPVKNIPIQVHYEPGKERISHFRPFRDFTRISLLNTWLVTLALLYHIPFRFVKSLTRENIRAFMQKHFFNKEEAASRKALSIGFGAFMGIFPVWGYQMIIGVALAHLMKLNKALVLVAANISIPPMIPFIIYGSYQMGGFIVPHSRHDLLFSTGLTLDLVKANLVQYVTGAIVLAFVAGFLATIITYFLLWLQRSRLRSVD
jgi:glycosyltransferase involved in cell wall biosynthesis